jgi:hypothetical protein
VPRRVFGPKRELVVGGWRGLHDEKLHNLYTPPNVIMLIKSRMLEQVGYEEGMEEIINAYKVWLENLKGRDYLENLGTDGKI